MNRILSPAELTDTRVLLDDIRTKLVTLSNGNADLLFAIRRKVYKELSYDERSKPTIRKRLKAQKRKQQNGLCPICNTPLSQTYCVLDRLNAADGYTSDNTRLIHQTCDTGIQVSRCYA